MAVFKIIIIIIIVLILLYIISKNNTPGEPFTNIDGSVTNSLDNIGNNIGNNLDPQTIRKLKNTILSGVSRASSTELAYNDIASYHPGYDRPFNNTNTVVSYAEAQNVNNIADMFDNSYYRLWSTEQERDKFRAIGGTFDLDAEKTHCIDFQNVNQCMSTCSDTDSCRGFYIDKPNSCCMIIDPPYNYYRNNYDQIVDNNYKYSNNILNALIKEDKDVNDRIVFNKFGSSNNNNSYSANLNRQQCKEICPKCIMGKCPVDYRCTDMYSDPRYNFDCIISNEDRYNENIGETFDNPNIPYLNEKYGIDQYAGFNANLPPIDTTLPNMNIRLDNGIMPERSQFDIVFANFKNGTGVQYAEENLNRVDNLLANNIQQI